MVSIDQCHRVWAVLHRHAQPGLDQLRIIALDKTPEIDRTARHAADMLVIVHHGGITAGRFESGCFGRELRSPAPAVKTKCEWFSVKPSPFA